MKFLVDRMLGKLAKALRLLGYDTVYYQGKELYPLIRLGREQHRIILTRNSKLKPRRPEDRVIHITQDDPRKQIRELHDKGLIAWDEERCFSRCLICNVLLDRIPRGQVEGKVPDFVFHHYDEFYHCTQCGRIYWPGTHLQSMRERISQLLPL